MILTGIAMANCLVMLEDRKEDIFLYPHSLNLVDPLPGHLEVHHDQVPHQGSQPVYWDQVQTGPNLWLCYSCFLLI